MWKYGDSESVELRAALAEHGVTPENIIVGEGIDRLLGYLVRLLVGEGDAVVTSKSLPTFNCHVAGFGGVLHKVPYRDDHEDPAALSPKRRRWMPPSTSPIPTTRWALGMRARHWHARSTTCPKAACCCWMKPISNAPPRAPRAFRR